MTESKIYKFKLDDLSINVTIDNSFTHSSERKDISIGTHCHALHEMFFVKSNPYTLFDKENTKEYKNCVVCIPPLFYHNSARGDDYRILFSYRHTDKKSSDLYKYMESLFSSPKPVSAKINSSIIFYIDELTKILSGPDKLSSDMVSSLLKLIFYTIYKCNTNVIETENPKPYDSYLITIDDILSDYQRDINLQTVSDALKLSTKQTSRIIRSKYKTSLAELITTKRLEVACELLISSDMNISNIVEHINFPSESYFYSQFKKKYGCTPLKYKKSKEFI